MFDIDHPDLLSQRNRILKQVVNISGHPNELLLSLFQVFFYALIYKHAQSCVVVVEFVKQSFEVCNFEPATINFHKDIVTTSKGADRNIAFISWWFWSSLPIN